MGAACQHFLQLRICDDGQVLSDGLRLKAPLPPKAGRFGAHEAWLGCTNHAESKLYQALVSV